MGKTLSFFLAVLAVVVFAFMYLNWTEFTVPSEFDDPSSDRCAKFRDVDPDDQEIFSLGYGGRIRQILSGCF